MPLLLAQAVWARFNTLKLPEALGERTGHSGNGDSISLLIVGDSAAAGVGANLQEEALVGQLSSTLAIKKQIQWKLVAKSGLTSTDIVKELESLPPQNFDLILVSVGVNDVTHFTKQTQWVNNILTIVELLNTKFNADEVILSSIPPVHLFTALPQPLRWWLGIRAKKLNTLMATAVENSNKCSVLTVKLPFSPEYLAKDGFHPSTKAYKVWADQAAAMFTLSLKESLKNSDN
ncbi:MAG: SGNH/GDSL hydrolase family protein [Cognaticolwellia sp.]